MRIFSFLYGLTLTSGLFVTEDGSSVYLEGLGNMHAEWLRERCQSTASVDPVTRQRLKNPHEYDMPRVNNASLSGEYLNVVFRDGHQSTFDINLLRSLSMGESFMQFDDAQRPTVVTWNNSLGAPHTFSFDAVSDVTSSVYSPAERLKLYRALQSTGIAILKDAPAETGVCSAIARNLSTLRSTEWGEMFNVQTIPDSVGGSMKFDLAYSQNAIGMHTDNPYRFPTPDFQLLHAISQCSCGDKPAPCQECTVMNYFSDGFAVADRIATETPELFDALVSTVVRFENDGGDGSSALWNDAPHLEMTPQAKRESPPCRGARCLKAVRYSAKSGGYAPFMPPDQLETFYAAKRRFAELIHDDSMIIKLQFQVGDIAVFDNTRLLHSRSAIRDSDGYRRLQGCYMDRDGVEYKWEQLRRQLANFKDLEYASKEAHMAMDEEYGRIDLANSLVGMLDRQKDVMLGQSIDLREHGLQTATRALHAGENDDLIIAGLFHAVTKSLVPKGHGAAAAALLAPYVDPNTHWILSHYEVFEGFYYYHHFGGDQHARDALYSKDNAQQWEMTRKWCHDYVQASYDPAYPSLPIEFFKPIIRRVLDREPYWWDPSHFNYNNSEFELIYLQ